MTSDAVGDSDTYTVLLTMHVVVTVPEARVSGHPRTVLLDISRPWEKERGELFFTHASQGEFSLVQS